MVRLFVRRAGVFFNLVFYLGLCFSIVSCADSKVDYSQLRIQDFLGPTTGVANIYAVSDGLGSPATLRVEGLTCQSQKKCKVRETMSLGHADAFKEGEVPALEYDLVADSGSLIRYVHGVETILLKAPLLPNPNTWEMKDRAIKNDRSLSVSNCGIARVSREKISGSVRTLIHVECIQKVNNVVFQREISFASGIGFLRSIQKAETIDGRPVAGMVKTELLDIKRVHADSGA